MLIPIFERRFLKEVQKAQKRGKDMEKLKDIVQLLLSEKVLPAKNRNHKLKGNFSGYWECHIEPDWLLVYKLKKTEVIFARMGTHSDLFDK
jgi:mRNA interferase YafQ